METVKNIAAILGCVLSAISLITFCTRSGRAFVRNLFNNYTHTLVEENQQQSRDIAEIRQSVLQLNDKINALEEVSKQQCRDTIKNIYYKYYKTKKIPLYERKTIDYTYSIYNSIFHGNTYAELLYKEICSWEIDTIAFQDGHQED